MKTQILLLSLLFTSIFSFAQQTGEVVIFSNTGEQFYVVLNGVRQNMTPETNVKIDGLQDRWYSCKVISANSTFELEKNIGVKMDSLVTYRITEKKGKYKLRFYSERPFDNTVEPNQTVVTYHATENVNNSTENNTNVNTNTNNTNTNTTTTTTTTTTNTGGTNNGSNSQTTTFGMGVSGGSTGTGETNNGGGSINISIDVNENNGNMNSGVRIDENSNSTSTTTTTTSTSSSTNVNGETTSSSTYEESNSSTVNGQTTTSTYSESTTTTTNGGGVEMNTNVNISENGGGTTMTTTETNNTNVSSNNSGGCYYEMSAMNFEDAKKSIQSKSFADSKMTVAKQVVDNNCLSSKQIKEITNLFEFEDDKLTFAKYAYAKCIDQNNYYLINDSFEFDSSVEELNNFINGTTNR